MTRIAFIGLGNMGGGMAARQVVGGRDVQAFDLTEAAVKKAVKAGATGASSVAKAVDGADVVITMLPAGPHVRKVYDEHILRHAPKIGAADRLLDHRCRKRARRREAGERGGLSVCRRASVGRNGGGGRRNVGVHGRL